MADRNPKSPVVLGMYIGVILGAIGMMLGGILNNTTMGEVSLLMGLAAGPSIGWLIGKWQDRKAKSGTDGASEKAAPKPQK